VQSRQSAGRRINYCVLPGTLDGVRDLTLCVEVFNQHVICFERRQRLYGSAPWLEEAARLSRKQQRAKDWNCFVAAINNFDDTTIAIVKRLELVDCLLDTR